MRSHDAQINHVLNQIIRPAIAPVLSSTGTASLQAAISCRDATERLARSCQEAAREFFGYNVYASQRVTLSLNLEPSHGFIPNSAAQVKYQLDSLGLPSYEARYGLASFADKTGDNPQDCTTKYVFPYLSDLAQAFGIEGNAYRKGYGHLFCAVATNLATRLNLSYAALQFLRPTRFQLRQEAAEYIGSIETASTFERGTVRFHCLEVSHGYGLGGYSPANGLKTALANQWLPLSAVHVLCILAAIPHLLERHGQLAIDCAADRWLINEPEEAVLRLDRGRDDCLVFEPVHPEHPSPVSGTPYART